MSEGVIATRERAAQWAKGVISGLWAPVDSYDGKAVGAFTVAAAKHMGTAQKATAIAAAAGQKQMLTVIGVRVAARPSDPIDVRARGAVFNRGRVRLQRGDVTVDYAGQKPVDLDVADSSTVEIFNRPARVFRYLESQGATREQAAAAASQRLSSLIEDNLMLAQRFAEAEVINAAADLDRSPVVGMRRIIHPELSRSGTCGLCIAASDRLYTVRELLPMHANCKCTSAPVTEDHDPAEELNKADLRRLYRDAGGTSRAHLKRTRYKADEHGELGPTLVPQRRYKPRSKGSQKAAAGTAVGAPESQADVARRHLPILENNLQKLREALSDESAQVKYHVAQIEKFRAVLAGDQQSGQTRGTAASRAEKGMDEKTPKTAPGGGGGEPPIQPPARAPQPAADDGDPRISDRAWKHILTGDANGTGGHQYGMDNPGATEFPERWTRDVIMAAVIETLNSPYHTEEKVGFTNLIGYVDGVRVLVRVDESGAVLTAHPLDGDGVARNDRRDGAVKKQLPLGAVRNVPLPS